MTNLPVPASRPWFIIRARLVLVPTLSLAYQLRISFTRAPMVGVLSRRAGMTRVVSARFSVVLLGQCHIVGAAEDDRRALVVLPGFHFENPSGSSAGPPPRLLHDEAHRGHLVQQSELRLRLGRVGTIGGVHEQTAIEQRAMNVGHHGARVPKRVRTARRLVRRAQEVDEGPLPWMPRVVVAFVDAVDLSAPRDPDV